MMQPMVNPNYFNQYPNYAAQNYYSNPPMQNPAPYVGISGRYVNTFEEITANDVPMDGKSALFMKWLAEVSKKSGAKAPVPVTEM